MKAESPLNPPEATSDLLLCTHCHLQSSWLHLLCCWIKRNRKLGSFERTRRERHTSFFAFKITCWHSSQQQQPPTNPQPCLIRIATFGLLSQIKPCWAIKTKRPLTSCKRENYIPLWGEAVSSENRFSGHTTTQQLSTGINSRYLFLEILVK